MHLDDPSCSSLTSVDELQRHQLEELRRFFMDYKRLEKKEVVVNEIQGPEVASTIIKEAMERYQKQKEELLEQYTRDLPTASHVHPEASPAKQGPSS